MEKTIEVDDATTIRIKLISWGKWGVTVNGVEVPTQAEKISFASYNIRFELADGRKALIAQRAQPGTSMTHDARVAEQELLDPGKHPFKCPSCRAVVRPRDRVCTQCAATLPSAAQRIEERCGYSASRGLRTNALSMSVLMVAITFTRAIGSPQARAELRATQVANGAAHAAWASAWIGAFAIWGTAIVATLGCAVLARRAPVDACWLHFGTWFVVFAFNGLLNPHLSFVTLAFEAVLLWNMARMARYARAGLAFTFPD
jgi:hypothetical protein